MPEITFNGERKSVDAGSTAESALRQAGVDPASFIVLLNGEVLDAKAVSSSVLSDGDGLDLLKLAGGG